MHRCLLFIIGLLISFVVSAQNGGDNMLVKNKSQFGFGKTFAAIETSLKELGVPVFAVFDHGKNAEEAGLKLNPNKVIVFGSPKVGTLLMQENPEISIELPLRISVWQDDNGHVWVAYPDMLQVAVHYNLANDPIIKNMRVLLEKIVVNATIGEK